MAYGDPQQTDYFDPTQKNPNTGVNGGKPYPNIPGGGPMPSYLLNDQSAPAAPQAPAAQTQVGHDGTYNGQTRDQWRDWWMGQGAMTPDQANQRLQGNGATQVNGNNGTWTDPFGDTLDMQIGRGAAVANGGTVLPGWTPIGGAGSAAGAGGATAGGAGGSFMGGVGGSDFQNQIRAQLMQLLQQSQQPVDENAANIAQPFAAAQLQAQRGSDQERTALAERLAAQGGGSGLDQGALTRGVQQGQENMAVGLAGIKSNLIGQAYQQKAQQLQQALSLAVQSGDAESARQLQMALAQMNQQYQYAALGQQGQQFNDTLGFNYANLQAQLNRQAMLDAAAQAGG